MTPLSLIKLRGANEISCWLLCGCVVIADAAQIYLQSYNKIIRKENFK